MSEISEENRKRLSDALEKVLADTYALFLKTQNYHWNVVGPEFNDLHDMFQKQYEGLFEQIDEVAERIRQLGFKAEGTFDRFKNVTSIKDGDKDKKAMEMVEDLKESHEEMLPTLREVGSIASEAKDYGTMDFVGDMLQDHEKTLWMLRSLLE